MLNSCFMPPPAMRRLCTRRQYLLAGLLVSAATPAMAQTEPVAQSNDDIVVTAQRRAQPLSDTPVTVTAMSGQQLTDMQVHSARDLAGLIPNLTTSDPGTSLQFNIRGQSLIDVSDVNEAPVAMYVDNVYVAATAGQGTQLFDLDRVEVLRGPQGTLFGRNASAGLIHFVTKRPTDDLDGYASAQVGNFGQLIMEGAIGGAIAPGVRTRVSVQRNYDDGYQQNLASGGGRFGKTDSISGRAQVEFDLGADATLLVRGYGTRQRNVHPLYAYVGRLDANGQECSPSQVLAYQCMSATGYRVANPTPGTGYTDHTPGELPDNVDLYGADAQLEWKLGNITLTSITAYSHLKRELVDDADASEVGIGNYGDFNYTERFNVKARQVSQELRLSGGEGGFHWTAGAYYFNDHRDALLSIEELETAQAPFDTVGSVKTESWSAFGQVDYPLSSKLGVTAGARYTHDSKRAEITTCDQFSNCPTLNNGSYKINGDNVSGKLGLEWRPQDHWLVYGNVSSGYKSGEFNLTFLGGALGAATPVGAEKTYNFEVGTKRTLFGGAAQLDIALFHTITKDKQAVATTSISSSTLINIGDVTSTGAEIELSARPKSWLRTQWSVGLLHTNISSPSDVVIYRNYNRDALGLNGNTFPNSPTFSINGLVRPTVYRGEIGQFDLQADFHFQTKVDLDVANSPYDVQGSYGSLNLRAFWKDKSDRLNISLFVENVTNASWYSRATSIAGLDYRFSIWGSKPRTYGARFGVNF